MLPLGAGGSGGWNKKRDMEIDELISARQQDSRMKRGFVNNWLFTEGDATMMWACVLGCFKCMEARLAVMHIPSEMFS